MIPVGRTARAGSGWRRRWLEIFWYQIGPSSSACRCFFDTIKRDPDLARAGYLIPDEEKTSLRIFGVVDRLPASPAATLFSLLIPGVFRCAATTANEL